MKLVDIDEAKSNLPQLVSAIEAGQAAEIVIARYGKPVARLLPVQSPQVGVRIGVAKGLFETPEPDADLDNDAAILFGA
jgi:antitoxin (DNA-binding transcriptional repressor) of toxin-antitoxin stability system